MKLQVFAICGLLAAPLAFAGGGKEQIQHEKMGVHREREVAQREAVALTAEPTEAMRGLLR